MCQQIHENLIQPGGIAVDIRYVAIILMDGDSIPQFVIEKGKRAFHSFMDIELLVIRFIQTYKIGKTPDTVP